MITVMRQTHGGRLHTNQQAALKTALMYFAEAPPKHTLDEEKSLFPRIRKLADDAGRSLDQLEQDHNTAETNHHQVNSLGQKWIKDGSLSSEDSLQLATALGKLSVILQEAHIYGRKSGISSCFQDSLQVRCVCNWPRNGIAPQFVY